MLTFSQLFRRQDNQYKKLHRKWSKKHSTLKQQLATKHKESYEWIAKNIPAKEHIAAGSLSGLLLLTPTSINAIPTVAPSPQAQVVEDVKKVPVVTFLLAELSQTLPQEVRELTLEEEIKVGEILSKHLGMKATAELSGKRLNRSYGLIGAEQHLMRYPGDTMATHFATQIEAEKYGRSGMAPGRGAWGYFTPSYGEMTQVDVEREKYYIAVQTFLAPGFRENVREHYEFFKYRKMVVVNPHNGRAMVVVIGDAGPAAWTGKHLGGSPEVMKYLERVDGRARGPVLYFFLDDPDDTIPLGPINLQ